MLELLNCKCNGTINIKDEDITLNKCIIENAIMKVYNCELFLENCIIKNCVINMNGILHVYDTSCFNSSFFFKDLSKIDFRNSIYVDTLINMCKEKKCIISVDDCTFFGTPFNQNLIHKCDFTSVNTFIV